jgi:hydrogenase maturation protease
VTRPRILVAGVGNIFRGDDAFGVEVVARLTHRPLPAHVRVVDFGIRGHDLAYAIAQGYDVVILVDATCRGGAPGTLYALEPDAPSCSRASVHRASESTHGVNLPAVFQLVRLLDVAMPCVRLVGCEPLTLGTEEDGRMGLSEPVRAAVEGAVEMIEGLITESHCGS